MNNFSQTLHGESQLALPLKPKKVAFVFSGGGSRGALQVGMLHRVREMGIKPDIVTGVSIGSINAFFAAQDDIGELEYQWTSIVKNSDIYRKRWLSIALMFCGLQLGYPSLFKVGPFAKRIQEIVRARDISRFIAELRIGAVDLCTGDFVSINQHHPMLDKFILGSTAIPLIFPPVRIKPKEDADLAGLYVDGCVRNLTPVSEAASLGATELHIFLTSGHFLPSANCNYRSWLNLADRVVSVNMHELMVDDIERVILNARMSESDLQVYLYHTKDANLQGMLDFNPESIRDNIDLGYILADDPITTDVLLKSFCRSEGGTPRNYYFVNFGSNCIVS